MTFRSLWKGTEEACGCSLSFRVNFFFIGTYLFGSNPLNSVVGVAHHVSFMWPYGLFGIIVVSLANSLTLFPYIDEISEKLDYIGINYYGQVCFINLDNALCMISGILTFISGSGFRCRPEAGGKCWVQWIWSWGIPWWLIPHAASVSWKI